jgi:hypothetical protein
MDFAGCPEGEFDLPPVQNRAILYGMNNELTGKTTTDRPDANATVGDVYVYPLLETAEPVDVAIREFIMGLSARDTYDARMGDDAMVDKLDAALWAALVAAGYDPNYAMSGIGILDLLPEERKDGGK